MLKNLMKKGVVKMQKGTQPSWCLLTDAPIDLNFAIYVACSFDLIPDTPPYSREQLWSAYRHEALDAEEHKTLVGQWNHWWNDLVLDRAQLAYQGRWSRHFAPNGHFDDLDTPLRTRCEEVFQSFKDWWGLTAGGQQGVNYWNQFVAIHQIVKRVETEIDRPVYPFKLTVDYVYTGLGKIVEIDSTYAIMSVHRPNVSVDNKDWWLAKVRELA
jgi:hypothetical protein